MRMLQRLKGWRHNKFEPFRLRLSMFLMISYVFNDKFWSKELEDLIVSGRVSCIDTTHVPYSTWVHSSHLYLPYLLEFIVYKWC